MSKHIEVMFGLDSLEALGDQRIIVLDGGPDPPTTREKGFDAAFAKLLWPLVFYSILEHKQAVADVI